MTKTAAAPHSSVPESRPARGKGPGQVVVVTGLSGAGKTSTLKVLEDLGFEAVDNVPIVLLTSLARPEGLTRPLAVGIDIRTRDFGEENIMIGLDQLKAQTGLDVTMLFLDAEDDVLARRFTETRRKHPLAQDRPLLDGIRHERQLVSALKVKADMVFDTSALAPGQLKRWLTGHFQPDPDQGLMVFVTSFAYRQGLPREADLVFDVRFLQNPHYIAELREKTGCDAEVGAYVANDPQFATFFDSLTSLLSPLLPRYAEEGKSYLTIAIGCTGGRHRSVYVAERLAQWFKEKGNRVDLRHREIGG